MYGGAHGHIVFTRIQVIKGATEIAQEMLGPISHVDDDVPIQKDFIVKSGKHFFIS